MPGSRVERIVNATPAIAISGRKGRRVIGKVWFINMNSRNTSLMAPV